jgi:hypothetical protein
VLALIYFYWKKSPAAIFSRPYTFAAHKKRGFCGLLGKAIFSRPYTFAGGYAPRTKSVVFAVYSTPATSGKCCHALAAELVVPDSVPIGIVLGHFLTIRAADLHRLTGHTRIRPQPR